MTHLWDDRVLPRLVSVVLSTREVGRHRAEVASGLAGTVLEIGFGSGLNLPHYPSAVEEVTIPDASTALREVRRVLRPGGRLHFLEHGLSPEPAVAARQHRLNGMQRKLFGGCHLDRRIDRLVEAAGFDLVELDTAFMRGPSVLRPWSYLYRGVAVPTG